MDDNPDFRGATEYFTESGVSGGWSSGVGSGRPTHNPGMMEQRRETVDSRKEIVDSKYEFDAPQWADLAAEQAWVRHVQAGCAARQNGVAEGQLQPQSDEPMAQNGSQHDGDQGGQRDKADNDRVDQAECNDHAETRIDEAGELQHSYGHPMPSTDLFLQRLAEDDRWFTVAHPLHEKHFLALAATSLGKAGHAAGPPNRSRSSSNPAVPRPLSALNASSRGRPAVPRLFQALVAHTAASSAASPRSSSPATPQASLHTPKDGESKSPSLLSTLTPSKLSEALRSVASAAINLVSASGSPQMDRSSSPLVREKTSLSADSGTDTAESATTTPNVAARKRSESHIDADEDSGDEADGGSLGQLLNRAAAGRQQGTRPPINYHALVAASSRDPGGPGLRSPLVSRPAVSRRSAIMRMGAGNASDASAAHETGASPGPTIAAAVARAAAVSSPSRLQKNPEGGSLRSMPSGLAARLTAAASRNHRENEVVATDSFPTGHSSHSAKRQSLEPSSALSVAKRDKVLQLVDATNNSRRGGPHGAKSTVGKQADSSGDEKEIRELLRRHNQKVMAKQAKYDINGRRIAKS